MSRARPSKFVHQMMRPVMAQKIAAEAANVREFVSENLLLARMCMESGHISDRALGSLITGLRIVRTVADALKDARLCRIIDGADTPASQIVERFKDGVTQAQRMELARSARRSRRAWQCWTNCRTCRWCWRMSCRASIGGWRRKCVRSLRRHNA